MSCTRLCTVYMMDKAFIRPDQASLDTIGWMFGRSTEWRKRKRTTKLLRFCKQALISRRSIGLETYQPDENSEADHDIRPSVYQKLLLETREEPRCRILRSTLELSSVSSGPDITATEDEMALRVFIRNRQTVHYLHYSQRLLRNLNVYQDDHGILRCKGRIGRADVSPETKRPLLNIPKIPLAEAIVKEGNLHTMPEQTTQ
ncbi:hypothetical protein KIN20_027009 [Parelaphostrongylus tenuis]|uniref:Uncharacterized protein n=1 Tax=Parelaphostrongylus tenuis TaxID=148309 RepID=A0AAD5QYS2_PARTN|nr:hypothetical protein KIN20_027009 [Parelaphostrongylus tenuis]